MSDPDTRSVAELPAGYELVEVGAYAALSQTACVIPHPAGWALDRRPRSTVVEGCPPDDVRSAWETLYVVRAVAGEEA